MSDEKLTDEKFALLIKLLMEREKQQADRVSKNRKRWAWSGWFFSATQIFNHQSKCSHRKNGRMRDATQDYAVSLHTFIDGSQRIACLICGWEVYNKPGWRFKWQFGMSMVKKSTNTPTSSEMIPNVVKERLNAGEICLPVKPKSVSMEQDKIKGNSIKVIWD